MKRRGLISQVKEFLNGPETQGSLFHYVKPEENGATRGLTWREAFSLLIPSKEPKTQASLFQYIKPADTAEDSSNIQISPELLERLTHRQKGAEPNFIPSLFVDFAELGEEVRLSARRRRIMGAISAVVHVVIISFVVYLVAAKPFAPKPKPKDELVTMVLPPPPLLKVPGNNKPGGGGGGGGRQEVFPASVGRLPKTSPSQLVPPDPKPIEPKNDAMIAEQTVVIPIVIPQTLSLPIGDPTSIAAPPSSGTGVGGGIGAGRGTGIGSGKGGGFGPGEGGGMGGGKGGGIGSGIGSGIESANTAGIRDPVPLTQPLPPYTEDGRRNKIMGVVVLRVIIRKDGSVDNAQIVRGLGHGLDESALQTVITKWKFRPAILNGRPVDYAANIEVAFNLL